VIVTTYNRKEFLSETLNSILNQTFSDFELIVVDNFSNYYFFELIRSFNDERIHPYQNKNNGIIAINRNFGIKKAKGNYIAFCDDDDVWVENKLEKQVEVMEEENSSLVSSNVYVFKKNISDYKFINKKTVISNIHDLLKLNPINTSSVLVKNTSKVLFPEDRALVAIEDFALWIELYIYGYKFSFIEEALVYYRDMDNFSKNNKASTHYKLVYLFRNVKHKYRRINVNKHILINIIKYSVKSIVKILS